MSRPNCYILPCLARLSVFRPLISDTIWSAFCAFEAGWGYGAVMPALPRPPLPVFLPLLNRFS